MQHQKWERSGRLFNHLDESGSPQLTYKSAIGQVNYDNGDETFSPYVWDSQNKILKFGNCEARLITDGIEFWAGGVKRNTLAFHPELFKFDVDLGIPRLLNARKLLVLNLDNGGLISGNWGRKTPTVGSLTTQIIDNGGPKVRFKISYKVSTEDQEATINLDGGCNQKIHFNVNMKALKQGHQRCHIQFNEVGTEVPRTDMQGNPLPPTKVDFGNSWFGFLDSELSLHEIKQEQNSTRISLGTKDFNENEEIDIHPDTWGTDIGIAAGGNDGYGIGDLPYQDYDATSSILGFGNKSADSHYDANLRWTGLSSIPQGSTINTALLDGYFSEWYAGGIATVSAWDVDEAPVNSASTGNYIWDTPKTTANVSWNPGGTGWKTLSSAGFVAVLQEIFTSYATDAMNLQLVGSNGINLYAVLEAYEDAGTNEAELTITYTPAGGGLSIPVAMANYRQRRT